MKSFVVITFEAYANKANDTQTIKQLSPKTDLPFGANMVKG